MGLCPFKHHRDDLRGGRNQIVSEDGSGFGHARQIPALLVKALGRFAIHQINPVGTALISASDISGDHPTVSRFGVTQLRPEETADVSGSDVPVSAIRRDHPDPRISITSEVFCIREATGTVEMSLVGCCVKLREAERWNQERRSSR